MALLVAWGVVAVTLSPSAAAVKVTAGEAAAYYARNYLVGKKYVLGGREESRFDCSGSVYLAWKQVLPGVVGAGSSKSQFSTPGTKITVGTGTTLKSSDLKPGDLMFWSDTGRVKHIDHVAIYLGNGQILQTADGKRSWIGGVNDNKDTRLSRVVRPEGSQNQVSAVEYDAMKAGLADAFEYGDFNGDGFDDVMWFTGTMSSKAKKTGVQVAYGGPEGFGSFRRQLPVALAAADEEFAIGDFNGDGRDDLLWFTGVYQSEPTEGTGWQVAYATEDGFADFTLVKQSALTPASSSLEYGDFNGDGFDDVLWLTGSMNEGSRWTGWQLAAGTPEGFTPFSRAKGSTLSSSWASVAAGDFDGDGIDDILWFTGTKDAEAAYNGWQLSSGGVEGFTNFARVSKSSTTPETRRLAWGDFDGDGADDVLWFTGTNSSTTKWSGWHLASGTAEGMTAWVKVRRGSVSPWTSPLAYGDFDNDGADDVLWFTGTRNTSKKYWGWQLDAGSESGFGSFVQVSTSGYTPYRQ